MEEQTDSELLSSYARDRSETAFTELVRRYIDLVHSAALRMMRDSHLAEDVTQNVFIALAKNAARLTDRAVLSGWLHRTAQNIASQTVRTDVRRRHREQEAATMNELLQSDTPWDAIASQLDDALNELGETDRDALLLRYFERKSAHEIAVVLCVSDEAAQKRVSRAVERLRELFYRRGVAVGAGALVVMISANAVQSAPVTLTTQVASGALTGATCTTTAKVIATTALQKALVGTTLAAAIGTGIFEAHRASQFREQTLALKQQQAPLAAQIHQLQQERNDATNRLAALQTQLDAVSQNNVDSLKLRGESTPLRQDSAGLAQMNGALKDKTVVQAGFMNLAAAQLGTSMTNAALRKLNTLKDKLGLTLDQQRQLRTVLMRSAESQFQAALGAAAGKPAGHTQAQLAQLPADENSRILALLTPDQQLAFQDLQSQEAADDDPSFANRESTSMQSELGLSDEQVRTVFYILANLPTSEEGLSDAATNAMERLNRRLRALSQTLTPAQLAAYQQSKLAEIQQATTASQIGKSVGQEDRAAPPFIPSRGINAVRKASNAMNPSTALTPPPHSLNPTQPFHAASH